MQIVKPENLNISNLFYQELLDVVVILFVNILIFFITDINTALRIQIFVIPILAYYAFAKHKKQVTKITIDCESKKIELKINTMILWDRTHSLPFSQIYVIRKPKLLFKSYLNVIEFRFNEKIIAIIPYKQSIWRDKELDNLALILKDYVSFQDRSQIKT